MQTSSANLSSFETISALYNQGGFNRFWKGSFVLGSACVPAHAFYFSIYEIAKVKLGVENKVNHLKLFSGVSIFSICNNWGFSDFFP